MLWRDLQHKAKCFTGRRDTQSVLRVLLSDGTSAVVLYRWAQGLRRVGLGFLGWGLLELNKFLNGCVIGRATEFGAGFVLMHPVGVVINGGVRGGGNVVLESGVVIGAARHGLPVRVPVLGDDVFVGAGAKILGDIRIGNHVTIGANAVVVRDVPDNATVVGIPARVIKTGKERSV